jgi:hypothetical protein
MKQLISACLLALLIGTPLFAEDDGLDEVLQLLKEKSRRSTYSTQADLDEPTLVIKKELTKEEIALEEKIKDKELQLESHGAPTVQQATPRPTIRRAQPAEKQNWLTPELLGGKKEKPSQDNEPPAWLTGELSRRELLTKEQKNIENSVAERMNKTTSTQLDQSSPSASLLSTGTLQHNSQQFGSPLQPHTSSTSYLGSEDTRTATERLSPILYNRKQPKTKQPSIFSIPTASQKRQSDSKTITGFSTTISSKQRNSTPQSITSGTTPWNKKESKQSSQLQRNQTPVKTHYTNPHSSDVRSKMKGDIWDN